MVMELQTAGNLIYAELNTPERVIYPASSASTPTCYMILHEIETLQVT